MSIHIGISGWRYAPWRGTFYPTILPQRLELKFASRMLSSIEINGSFYNLQRPQSYASWYADTPSDFVFSVKAPRYITHIRRLHDIETPLANFFASGIFNLREKLGPILWQFPPSFRFDEKLLDEFFKRLPGDTQHASEIAREYDKRFLKNVQINVEKKRALRHAIEIRHDSFVHPDFIALLRHYHIALVVADSAGKWPDYEDLSSNFIYMRLHGDAELYASGYTGSALKNWAERIRLWHAGAQPTNARLISNSPPQRRASRDVYCYFDNDMKVHAPFDAATLASMLGESAKLFETSEAQRDNFAKQLMLEEKHVHETV